MFPNRYEVMFTDYVYSMMKQEDTRHSIPQDSKDINAWEECFKTWYIAFAIKYGGDGLGLDGKPYIESEDFLMTIPMIWKSWLRGFDHIYLYQRMNGPDIMKEAEELHKQFDNNVTKEP